VSLIQVGRDHSPNIALSSISLSSQIPCKHRLNTYSKMVIPRTDFRCQIGTARQKPSWCRSRRW